MIDRGSHCFYWNSAGKNDHRKAPCGVGIANEGLLPCLEPVMNLRESAVTCYYVYQIPNPQSLPRYVCQMQEHDLGKSHRSPQRSMS